MTISEIVSSSIAFVALIVSLATAYKTQFTRFSGRVWPASRLALSHVDDIPSIGLACTLENSGAKPGMLDDLRLVVRHNESGATYAFTAHLMRNDYGVAAGQIDTAWFLFSGTSLPARDRIDRSILFRPQLDQFRARPGSYEVSMESRWYGAKKWRSAPHTLHFNLTDVLTERWNDPKTPAIQVMSNELLEYRRIFDDHQARIGGKQ